MLIAAVVCLCVQNEFNDINKIIIRQHVRTEYKIAFPYLYNSRPRRVYLAQYHYPANVFIKSEDPDLPAFYFDPILAPISHYKTGSGVSQKLDDDVLDPDSFELPDDVVPLMAEAPLFTEQTAAGITLYHAPRPYNQRSGRTRRALDIPLIGQWTQEHVDSSLPVKVKVSYQKLLKVFVLNALHHRPPKALNKKNMFASFRATKFFQSVRPTIDRGWRRVRPAQPARAVSVASYSLPCFSCARFPPRPRSIGWRPVCRWCVRVTTCSTC